MYVTSSGLIYLIEDGNKLFKTLLEQGKYILNINLKLLDCFNSFTFAEIVVNSRTRRDFV